MDTFFLGASSNRLAGRSRYGRISTWSAEERRLPSFTYVRVVEAKLNRPRKLAREEDERFKFLQRLTSAIVMTATAENIAYTTLNHIHAPSIYPNMSLRASAM